MRGGLAVNTTWSGRALPIMTVVLADAIAADTAEPPVIEPLEKPTTGASTNEGPATAPPENAWTVAVPERLSETRLTRTTPSFVLPCSSIFPRLVKNCTTVPSATGYPVAFRMRPEITETSPCAAMKPGLAMREPAGANFEPGGAVIIAWLHVPRSRTRSSTAAFLGVMRHLPSYEASRRHRHAHRRRDAELLRSRHGDDRQRVRRHRPRPLAQGAERDGSDHAGARRPGGARKLGPSAARLEAALDADRRPVEGQQRTRRHLDRFEKSGVVAEDHLHANEILGVEEDDREGGGLAHLEARFGRARRRGHPPPFARRHRRRSGGLHHGAGRGRPGRRRRRIRLGRGGRRRRRSGRGTGDRYRRQRRLLGLAEQRGPGARHAHLLRGAHVEGRDVRFDEARGADEVRREGDDDFGLVLRLRVGGGEDLVEDGDALEADDSAEGGRFLSLQEAADEARLAVPEAEHALDLPAEEGRDVERALVRAHVP